MKDMNRLFAMMILLSLAAPAVRAQENASSGSWVYMSAEDFTGDNRRFAGEYAVALAKGESRYKDSLRLVYAVARIDGNKKSDVSKDAWAVASGGQLYVNNSVLNDSKGYSKSFSPGRYNLFFTRVKESGEARKKYGYDKDDIRFYEKEDSKSRGSVNVGGIPIGLGSATLMFMPVVIDRKTGEMKAFSSAYREELVSRYPDVAPPTMNQARGVPLIEYFRQLNSKQ